MIILISIQFQDDLIGWQDAIIHSLNKNESAVHQSDSSYFEKLTCRENVILLGDNLGDLKMSQGVAHIKNILKIGFLNDKVRLSWFPE